MSDSGYVRQGRRAPSYPTGFWGLGRVLAVLCLTVSVVSAAGAPPTFASGSTELVVNGVSGRLMDPQWMSNNRIAFIDESDSSYPGEPVVSVNPDGSDPQPLAVATSVAWAYAASPTHVVYITRSDLYGIGSDGTSRLLASGVSVAGGLSLSPDGSRVAWFDNNSSTRDVMVIATDGSEAVPRRLTSGVRVTAPWDAPAWDPSGTEIVFGSYGSIQTVDLNGYVTIIVSPSAAMYAFSPAWGPSGTIAFWNQEGGTNGDAYELRLMDGDGNSQRVIAAWPAGPNDVSSIRTFAQPVWAPSGSKIAFAPLGLNTDSDLFVVDATSGDVNNLLADTTGDNVQRCQDQSNAVSFSPDGNQIAYGNLDSSGACGIFVATVGSAQGALGLTSDGSSGYSGGLQRVVATASAGVSPGTSVTFTIDGPNAQTATVPFDDQRHAVFFYFAGPAQGTDTITAAYSLNGHAYASSAISIAYTLPVMPPATRSHYEAYIGQKYFRNDGAQAGSSGKSGPVILEIGASTDTGQVLYGFPSRGGGVRPLGAITHSLEAFSNAYHNAWQGQHRGSVQIVWGTNSSFPTAFNNDLPRASAAGARFARAVLQFSNWVEDPQNHNGNDYNRQNVIGGIDIEEIPPPEDGWSAYPVVQAFLSGYASVAGHRPLLNYGALTFDPLCANDQDPCTYQGRGWTGGTFAATTRSPLADYACPQVYTKEQIDYWIGLEQATGTNTNLHKWGGTPIYFNCILAGDEFLPRQDAWDKFTKGLAGQKRMNLFAKKVTQIDTRAKAENRFQTGGASVPLQ